MQYLIVAHDGTDQDALNRRMLVREAHIKLGDDLVASGNLLFGVAILNSEGRMVGSVLVAEYPSRMELDAWLKTEPYVTGGVWQKIEISECRVGPSFAKLIS